MLQRHRHTTTLGRKQIKQRIFYKFFRKFEVHVEVRGHMAMSMPVHVPGRADSKARWATLRRNLIPTCVCQKTVVRERYQKAIIYLSGTNPEPAHLPTLSPARLRCDTTIEMHLARIHLQNSLHPQQAFSTWSFIRSVCQQPAFLHHQDLI